MGANNSKEQINEDLHNLGKQETEKIEDTPVEKPQIEVKKNIISPNNFIYKYCNSDPKKDYDIIKTLKEGVYSEINLVENKLSKMKCIMKSITKTNSFAKDEEDMLDNELKILSLLDHPNIINVYALYSNEDSYSYITEYCQEGDLNEQLMNKGAYDERKAAYIMFQIFSAVNYCHKNKIINRGLTIENILISEIKNDLPYIKLGYFGTSFLAKKNAIKIKNVQKIYYEPPEEISLGHKYIDKSDIWSCGVIMYFLLAARPPFGGEKEEERKNNILNENYDLETPPFDKISPECKTLLSRLLMSNPDGRPSAEEVLKDSWFIKNGSKSLFYSISRSSTSEKLINNIKNYNNISIFKKFSIQYLIHNFPQTTDVKNAAKLFYRIDSDGDGKITKDELYKGFNEILMNKINKKDFEQIFQNLDINNSGYIDYEEFVAAAVNKNLFMRENILYMAFKFFDKDNSGEITLDEIEMMFKEAVNDGKNDVHNELQKIMDEVDLNLDKKISFEEFGIFMKQLIK